VGIAALLESRDFQKRLSERTARLVNAPSGFKKLNWEDTTATSDGFLARGQPVRALQEIQAKGLTAQFDWSALWNRKVIVKQLSIDHLQAAFSRETATELQPDPADPPELQAPARTGSVMSVDLREVISSRTTILWGKTNDDCGAFREVAVRLWPVGKDLAIYGAGGTLQMGGLPQAEVRPFQLRYVKPNLDIEWGSLTLGGKSEVKVGGRFQFTQPGRMELALGFHECPIKPFLSPEMRSKFDGSFESNTRVRQELGGDKPTTLEGSMQFVGATLKNVAGLVKLSAFTEQPRFKELHFQVLRGNYSYTKPKLTLTDLVAESPGLFQVEGDLSVTEGKLLGTVELGVSAQILKSFPGAREEIFTKQRNEYFWTRINLSGTTELPVDDLRGRLVAAAEKHPIKAVTAPVSKTLDIIKKPVESLIQKLKELF
jgi:hypothetical protein